MKRLIDRDLLAALVLLCIGAVFWVSPSADPKDWAFPRLATYLMLGIAVALVARVAFAAIRKRVPDAVHSTLADRVALIDVFVFLAIVLAYLFVMHGLGFWLSSLIMLALTSIYLTLEKTRRNLMLAVVVPLASCIVAYFIFIHVFYVPFPKPTWWPGLG